MLRIKETQKRSLNKRARVAESGLCKLNRKTKYLRKKKTQKKRENRREKEEHIL